MSSVRSASPASLYWDSPPRDSIVGATNSARSRKSAQRGRTGGGRGGGNDSSYHDGDGDDGDDGGGFVDLFTIESLMSGRAAGQRGIPPLAQDMEAVISDSGSAFDDRMVVIDSTTGLRRRRGENVPEPRKTR